MNKKKRSKKTGSARKPPGAPTRPGSAVAHSPGKKQRGSEEAKKSRRPSSQYDSGPQAKIRSNPAASSDSAQATQKNSKASTAAQDHEVETFPIVGVGASAGGLEAFKRLLSTLPNNSGMGIVFISHLNPTHESKLSEVLASSTRMPVVEAENGATVRPNHVYVIPPNANLAILRGVLHLMSPAPTDGRQMTIDYFLRSLAQDQGSRAIGVVLSGSNSDGALGLQAIKAEGGITFVQDEESAQYNTMPRSAVSAGAVDFVLPPEEIAAELTRIGQHPYVSSRSERAVETAVSRDGTDLNKIFIMLRNRTGVDFTYYKQTTIRRRMMRRLALLKIAGLRNYLKYLQENAPELSALYEDLLINVTNFFRDPDVYEALKTKVFPKLIDKRSIEAPIRMWVAGCATGEEAYSLAISLAEYVGDKAENMPIQIFATDVSEKVIDKARTGVYPENISLDVSPERLKRFFLKVEAGYQISKTIREMCVFSRQNLIKDPPFSRLDLISCRNVLIYMDSQLQRKIVPILHYALNPGGFIVLGTAETVGGHSDLFSVEDRKHKIYSRKSSDSHQDFGFSVPVGGPAEREAVPIPITDEARRKFSLQRESERIVLTRYGPAGVVIDHNLQIVLFRGHTGLFLEPAPGEVSLNIFSMAREGLMPELRAAIYEARNRNLPVRRDNLRIKADDRLKNVTVQVHPISGPASNETYYLVLFEDMGYIEGFKTPKKPPKSKPGSRSEDGSGEAVQLREELIATKEYLESVIAQHQATNEELKSANEEIQSSNEELQSINEELETAKEELQATNEELTTVNDELQNRNVELGQANDDLLNLLSSINVPVVMLGRDLRIRRFTPTAEKSLHLIPSDVGRSITDLKLNIEVPDLTKLISEVIDSLASKELEVHDKDGRVFHLRIRPYKTMDNRIGGAVLVWVDISGVRPAGPGQDSLRLIQSIADTAPRPIAVLDQELRLKISNKAFSDEFKVSRERAIDQPIHSLDYSPWNLPAVREFLAEAVQSKKDGSTIPVEYKDSENQKRSVILKTHTIDQADANGKLVLISVEKT